MSWRFDPTSSVKMTDPRSDMPFKAYMGRCLPCPGESLNDRDAALLEERYELFRNAG